MGQVTIIARVQDANNANLVIPYLAVQFPFGGATWSHLGGQDFTLTFDSSVQELYCVAQGYQMDMIPWTNQSNVDFQLQPQAVVAAPAGTIELSVTSLSVSGLQANVAWSVQFGAGVTLHQTTIEWGDWTTDPASQENVSGTSASHSYANAGTYQIQITAYATNGNLSGKIVWINFSANLLQNASFEWSSAGWFANNLASGVNLQQYNPGNYGKNYAHDGSGFLEMNTSQPSGSVAQDVTLSTQVGQSYSFSVWLRAAPGVSLVSGAVNLWGLGGTQESGSTSFTVGPEWTLVTAPLDVQDAGHTSLRAEIYMNTTGVNLDADGALLINAGLQNASFERSSAGWFANNLASAVKLQQYNPGPASYGPNYAHDGSGFLEMNTSQPSGSVAQDVTHSPQVGQSYSFSVWLRAAPGVSSVSGAVNLWGLGGTQESGSTNFTVGPEWTLVTAPLDVQDAGHTSLRAEIYMNTTGVNLDADGALLINAGLQNASFERSSAGWFANNLASAVKLQQYNPGPASYGPNYAHDGSGFLEMNTSQPSGSVAQDVTLTSLTGALSNGYPAFINPGQCYLFSVWLRAAPGESSVSGAVNLWGLGGTQESGSTNFTVGPEWTLVTAPLDVQYPGHTILRAEIYMNTTGVNLDADGATLTLGQPTPASP